MSLEAVILPVEDDGSDGNEGSEGSEGSDGNDGITLLFGTEVKATRLFTPAHDAEGEGVLINLTLADDSATLTEERTTP